MRTSILAKKSYIFITNLRKFLQNINFNEYPFPCQQLGHGSTCNIYYISWGMGDGILTIDDKQRLAL